MKKALIIVYFDTHFTELWRVARMLKNSGLYDPVFLFAQSYINMDTDLALCESEKIKCLDSAGNRISLSIQSNIKSPNESIIEAYNSNNRSMWKIWSRAILDYAPETMKRLVINIWDFVYLVNHYLHQIQSICRIIKMNKFDLIILAEDNVSLSTAIFIKSGHKVFIPSVIVPYTIANSLEPAEAFFNLPEFSLQRWSNRLVSILYPRWVYEHKGRRLLRLPAPQALAMEIHDLAPPLPWILNSGYADAIAVESEYMCQYYLREGLAEDMFVLTGSLYDDVLANTLKNVPQNRSALCEELELPPDRQMILCALPPNQHKAGREETDFGSYTELCLFWIQSLASIAGCKGYNIVIRLHPRLKYDEMRYLEQWGVKITQKDTASLIPLCDIFIASVSATIRWAIACGKPVLNYDVYRYRYSDYLEASGVITVEEKKDFLDTLHQLVQDQAFYNEVSARQASCSKQWGILDGQSAARMLRLFDQLTDNSERRAY